MKTKRGEGRGGREGGGGGGGGGSGVLGGGMRNNRGVRGMMMICVERGMRQKGDEKKW